MKTEFTEVSETRKHLTFEIPPDVVDAEIDRVAQGYSQHAKVPGFRHGKVPATRRPAALPGPDSARRGARPDSPARRRRAPKSAGLEPVATPDINDVVLEEGQPLTFVADFETLPPIDPGDYTGHHRCASRRRCSKSAPSITRSSICSSAPRAGTRSRIGRPSTATRCSST